MAYGKIYEHEIRESKCRTYVNIAVKEPESPEPSPPRAYLHITVREPESPPLPPRTRNNKDDDRRRLVVWNEDHVVKRYVKGREPFPGAHELAE
ncbi:hypothetical protein TKK_0008237 [Trichogramma kaykai]